VKFRLTNYLFRDYSAWLRIIPDMAARREQPGVGTGPDDDRLQRGQRFDAAARVQQRARRAGHGVGAPVDAHRDVARPTAQDDSRGDQQRSASQRGEIGTVPECQRDAHQQMQHPERQKDDRHRREHARLVLERRDVCR
jgi:hypothetical protein